MPVYSMSTFVRCAVVPQEGTPILFRTRELDASLFTACTGCTSDARVGVPRRPQAEADGWADETLAAIRERGRNGEVVAVAGWARPRISRCRDEA